MEIGLSPELAVNGCLPLFFVIALPNAIVDSWIQARTYQDIAANVLNHFPMKQLNCFMSLQGSITKLIHWMAQGHMESYWNDALSFIAEPMPNAWFRPIAKQAPLSGYYNWRNEGWIHWSTASSAFRTDEELTQYGIDHGTETFPEFPLPMRDQTIAWKVPLKIGTLLERAQQLSNPGNANGRRAIARHVVLPRGIACKMTGVLAACQLKDYEVIGLTYDRDRIDEAPQGSQIAIDSRRESAIVIPPGMGVRISQIAAPPLAIGSIESDARNWSHWDDQDSMDIDA